MHAVRMFDRGKTQHPVWLCGNPDQRHTDERRKVFQGQVKV
jgi:hypothetical protein